MPTKPPIPSLTDEKIAEIAQKISPFLKSIDSRTPPKVVKPLVVKAMKAHRKILAGVNGRDLARIMRSANSAVRIDGGTLLTYANEIRLSRKPNLGPGDVKSPDLKWRLNGQKDLVLKAVREKKDRAAILLAVYGNTSRQSRQSLSKALSEIKRDNQSDTWLVNRIRELQSQQVLSVLSGNVQVFT